jgi:hypothetical protein
MDEQDSVAGVLNGEQRLVGGEPYVDGVEDRPEHGHREETFEITVAVPIHDSDAVPGADSELGENMGEAFDAFKELRVGQFADVPVDDLLVGRPGSGAVQETMNQELGRLTRGRIIGG